MQTFDCFGAPLLRLLWRQHSSPVLPSTNFEQIICDNFVQDLAAGHLLNKSEVNFSLKRTSENFESDNGAF